LTLDGSAIFGAGVNTIMEIAGAGANQHDVLTVSDHFTLGGTLSEVDYHGFAAQAGDSFRIFEYGTHDGMFDQAVGLDIFGPVAMDILFDDTGATLVARTITAEGTEGGDTLIGTSAGDVLVGRGGDDILIGNGGDDLLLGGEGNNTLNGGAGDDRLIGGAGIDTADYSGDPAGVTVDLLKGFALDGWGGHDTLISIDNVTGTPFADTIIGNAKDNVINGNGGADILTGGAGADTFVLNSPNSAIASTITDFVSGQDKIQIDLSGFNFAPGTAQNGINFSVLASHFDGSLAGANTAFAGGQPSLIYSEADSTLYFDANGAQEGYTAVAHFQAGAHLVASDVRVVDHLMA
jgi:Ca2+-binding RTX toxin-like protein